MPESRLVAAPGRAAAIWRRVERFAGAVESVIGFIVEGVAATLVAAEVVILLCGVFARYVLGDALIWSDELASMLFIWLGMLGAAIAFRRREHMAMTMLLDRSTSGRRAWLESAALIVSLVFLLCIVVPAWNYALDEAEILTPALQVSDMWRAASLPVGLSLMLLFSVLQFARAARQPALWRAALVAVVVVLGARSSSSSPA